MNILESINIFLFYRYSIYYKILYSFYITKLSCISNNIKNCKTKFYRYGIYYKILCPFYCIFIN